MVNVSSVNTLPLGASICDPFCGVGGFLLESIIASPRLLTQFNPHNGTITPQTSLRGYDRGSEDKDDERTIILAKANTVIYFSDLIATHHSPDCMKEFSAKVINPMFTLIRSNLGTFQEAHDNSYDLILTNPPYVTRGVKSLKNALQANDATKDRYTAGGRGTESIAFQWIIKSLKPWGKAFVIVPDSLLSQKAILNHVKQKCVVHAIVSFQFGRFMPHRRKPTSSPLKKREMTGPRRQHQCLPTSYRKLGDLVTPKDMRSMTINCVTWHHYSANLRVLLQHLYPMIKDARLFHFSVSTVKLSWQVDQWWCDEEKECLGFHDTKDRVNLNKFSGTINSLSKTVKAIQNDIASIASSTSSNYKFVDCRIEEIFDIPSIKGVTKKFPMIPLTYLYLSATIHS